MLQAVGSGCVSDQGAELDAGRVLTPSADHRVPYDSSFFDTNDPGSLRSAAVILERVIDLVQPTSVVDVGCGTGTWLAACRAAGVADVVGIDGHYVDRAALRIPPEAFVPRDLTSPLHIDRTFDLAICLEVAEHLPATREGSLIDDLSALAPVVLFSAALPGQPGVDHINCQWCTHWASLFAARGYRAADPVRGVVWDDDRVEYWYAQNTLLYVSSSHIKAHPLLESRLGILPGPPLDLVHPRLLDELTHPGVRGALSTLGAASRRRLLRSLALPRAQQ